jgi:hypothetical protein
MQFVLNSKYLVLGVFLILFIQEDLSAQESRAIFFEKIAKVKRGMTTNEVAELIGKPDDVWNAKDDAKITDPHLGKVWCYGSKRHLSFPTLGRVEFDHDGRVDNVIGIEGKPFDLKVVSEGELRRLLGLISEAPSFSGRNFDPYSMLTIANEFQPLGQETSFSIFREFDRLSGMQYDRDGLYLLVLCLHELPKGVHHLPELAVGRPDVIPANPDQIPRFPIQFVDDVPLLLVNGYTFTGGRPRIDPLLRLYENKIPWKTRLLSISGKPLEQLQESLNTFSRSPNWFIEEPPHSAAVLSMLNIQLLRFVNGRDPKTPPRQ